MGYNFDLPICQTNVKLTIFRKQNILYPLDGWANQTYTT